MLEKLSRSGAASLSLPQSSSWDKTTVLRGKKGVKISDIYVNRQKADDCVGGIIRNFEDKYKEKRESRISKGIRV